MATIADMLKGKRSEVQTQINLATAEDLVPNIKQEGSTVIASNKLFTAALDTAVSTKEEIKESGSGAEMTAEMITEQEIKAIMDNKDEIEYPKALTEVFELDSNEVSAKKACKLIKALVKKYRKSYSNTKVKPEGFDFGTTHEKKLQVAFNTINEINRKLNDLKQTNKDAGYAIYNLEVEGQRLVATDTRMLAFLAKTDETVV